MTITMVMLHSGNKFSSPGELSTHGSMMADQPRILIWSLHGATTNRDP